MKLDRIAFVASDSDVAQASLERLRDRYASKCVEEADVVIALGGDGFMLETLHKSVERGVPI